VPGSTSESVLQEKSVIKSVIKSPKNHQVHQVVCVIFHPYNVNVLVFSVPLLNANLGLWLGLVLVLVI